MNVFFKIAVFFLVFVMFSCSSSNKDTDDMNATKIIFLHHSTGKRIWQGDMSSFVTKFKQKITKQSAVSNWFEKYNANQNEKIVIKEQAFPKREPYGWDNYPYDYYNIWVKNAGEKPYMEEPTLEILTKDYDVIVWKHCYPVSDVLENTGNADINSAEKRIENYKLQYNALKEKMHSFPDTKFLVWTGAALLETRTTEDNAKRAEQFFNWVIDEWDQQDDNIYIWDFRTLETDGGIFLNPSYASGEKDNHPNNSFSGKTLPLFCQRIVDIVKTNGTATNLKGEKK